MNALIRWIPGGLASLFFVGCGVVEDPKETAPPSLVWVICEDQSLFFPPYGDSTVRMPHIERLAAEGTVFETMFTVSPVCAPSRSSLLTGIQPNAMGTQHMRAYLKRGGTNPHTGLPSYSAPFPDGIRPFTESLRDAGVYCTNRGKEDYNFATPPSAWDESSPNAHWRSRPPGAPFFAVFNLFGSHESRIWEGPRHRDAPAPHQVPVPPLLPDLPAVRQDIATNYANLLTVDSLVGAIIRELEEDGLYEHTTLLFTSDHGGPFPGFKRSASDAGLHVPLIVKWAAGTDHPERNEGLFSFLDLAPSALAHFGVPQPDALPGQPILPFAEGHSAVFGAADRFDGDLTRQRTVRTSRWRLTRNHLPNPSLRLDIPYRRQMASMLSLDSLASAGISPWKEWVSDPAPELELYDIRLDPWQLHNLAQMPFHEGTIDSLQNQLDDAFNADNDWGRVPEIDMLRRLVPTLDIENELNASN